MTDANGSRVMEYEYSWLGEPRVTGSGVSGVPGQNPYQFQGRRVDPETELQLFRNRYYDPAVGEFWINDGACVGQAIVSRRPGRSSRRHAVPCDRRLHGRQLRRLL